MTKKKLTPKRKDEIKKHIENISQMGINELSLFDMNFQNSKHDIDEVVWEWVNKGVVRQLAYLMDIDVQSGGAMCVVAEFAEVEVI